MSDSFDRKLCWYERAALQGHLLACRVCTKLHRQLKLVREAVRAQADKAGPQFDTLSLSLSDEAKQQMKDSLRRHDG